MLNLNRAQVLGNLTRDAEMRFTPNGQAVANFSIATNRRWKNSDGTDGDSTEYHDIVVWGKQAENVSPMLKKGGPVFVEGRLQTRNWEGQDGVKRYKTEIIADNVIVLSPRSGGGNYATKTNDGPTNDGPIEEIAEDKSDNQGKKSDKPKEDEIDIEEIPF